MCLYTKNKEGYVSDKPVTCYKAYVKGDDGKLLSYYIGVKYDLKEGDEVVAEGKGDIECVGMISEYSSLGEGFIHAMENKRYVLFMDLITRMSSETISNHVTKDSTIDIDKIDDALETIKEKLSSTITEKSGSLCLCEMEIPAGERYWMEDFPLLTEGRNLCARRMIFKREINLEKKSDILEMVYELYYTKEEKPGIMDKWESLIETYKNKGE